MISPPTKTGRQRLLETFQADIHAVADGLGEHSPFEPALSRLMTRANQALGFYAGSFGRYRAAKPSGNLATARGVISVTPMYENTGISLGILQNGRNGNAALPTLSLTFDGTGNKADQTKVESFLFYI